ncbi:hypothetical protein OAS89_05870 [Alphaproteobacteria bacterium]|nr:hypothetical protein [Alphaproteobacteria bacterium]
MNLAFKYFACFAFLICSINTVNTANAQNLKSPEEIEKFLTNLYSKPETIQKIAKSFGVSPDKEAVVIEHMKTLLRDPKLIELMSQEFVSQGVLNKAVGSNKNSAYAAGMAFGYQFITKLTVDGLKRLSDERVLDYVNHTVRFFDVIEPKHCRALMGAASRQKDEIDASIAAIRNMSSTEMRSYFELNREAVNAELNDWPVEPTLNDYETKTATAAFEKELAEKLESHPSASIIITALTDPANARDQDFCTAGKFVIEVISGLKGMTGDWFRRSFVLSL